jgi:uncharacterized protein YjbI with pentapeptide repeats
MSLTRKQLIRSIAKDTGISQKKTSEILTALLKIITAAVVSEDYVLLRKFGKFHVIEKKARRVRHPLTREYIFVAKQKAVKFKSSICLKNLINQESLDATFFKTNQERLQKLYDIAETNNCILEIKNLKNANLPGIDLSEASLSRENLAYSNLSNANLFDTDLQEANLEGTTLDGATIMWSNLAGANLCKASLENADLRWTNLNGSDLTKTNLRNANLAGANLEGAKFVNSDLRGAKLKNTDLKNVKLKGSKLNIATKLAHFFARTFFKY